MRTTAQTTKLDPNLRTARASTRRRLHDPRPSVTSETRRRIGLWKTELKEAARARHIRAVDRLYADELLAFPSVTRGHYSMASDASMGRRLDVSDSTARRQRRRLDKAGLIEVLGHGVDGNSCLVRPILRDGTPVFPDPERPTGPVISGHPPRSELTADSFKQTLETEEPPLPPASVPDAPKEGEQLDQPIEDQPAEQPETVKPAEPSKPELSFTEFWVAMGQTGREGYARAKWGKLSPVDKAAIRDRLSKPRSWAADMWAGKWLECRVWEEAVPAAARPEQVFIRENTPEWRCWQRHLGRSMPVNSQGGWWFSSRLPPVGSEEARR